MKRRRMRRLERGGSGMRKRNEKDWKGELLGRSEECLI